MALAGSEEVESNGLSILAKTKDEQDSEGHHQGSPRLPDLIRIRSKSEDSVDLLRSASSRTAEAAARQRGLLGGGGVVGAA